MLAPTDQERFQFRFSGQGGGDDRTDGSAAEDDQAGVFACAFHGLFIAEAGEQGKGAWCGR